MNKDMLYLCRTKKFARNPVLTVMRYRILFMIHNLTGGGGTTPVSTNAQNHAGTNNFRRQNTVDSATIRENTARLAQGGVPTTSSSRSAALKNQNITALDPSGAPSKTGGKLIHC